MDPTPDFAILMIRLISFLTVHSIEWIRLLYLVFWLTGNTTWAKDFNSFFMVLKVSTFARSTKHGLFWVTAGCATFPLNRCYTSIANMLKSFPMLTVGSSRISGAVRELP